MKRLQNFNFKFKLKHSNIVATSITVFLCVLLAVNTIKIHGYNKQSIELSASHMKYTDVAMKLNLGSDILTEQARLFAETGNTDYMFEYFKEFRIARNRDNALSELEDLPWNDTEEKAKEAASESDKLMEREFYAMRLTALAYDIDENILPKEIKNVILETKDTVLSPDEMKEKARNMLFDTFYRLSKNTIKTNVDLFLNDMVTFSNREYDIITKKLNTSLTIQSILILLLFISLFIMAFTIKEWLIRPIMKAAKSIKKGLPIKMPAFLEEMHALEVSYNGLRQHNTELIEQMTDMAHKDALTGIGSRFAYNKYISEICSKKFEVLLFIFDVNNLRNTNNNEGHSQGDKLIIDTARCIKKVFGIYDHENCFRVGGDEFVAFIENEPQKRASVYLEQFREETAACGVSVSAGYTYTEDISEESINNLFNDADTNMYKEKYGDKK